MNPEKTQGGRLVGAINCQTDMAFEQMMDTKKQFGKTDKRQGYHIILSFKEDEVEPDRAFEITQKFVAEYLGDAYEAVFVVHDNTDHVHSHIVFNSVSFVDGKKYRYEKGDWAKYIQPITNKLCQEYGLSIIDVEDGSKEKQHENYKDWSEYREGSFVWADMIKRDLDACILQANDFSGFLELLSEKGYEVKQGKYLAVRPQGMTRFRRCKTLGENYSQEAIVERIAKEDLSFYQSQNEEKQAAIGNLVGLISAGTTTQLAIDRTQADIIKGLGFGESLVMLILTALLAIIIIICGFFIIYTVYFRFLKILIIVPLGAIACSTMAGNRMVSHTMATYCKYFLSCVFEAVTMALAIVVCNAFINAGLPAFTGSYADWAQTLICLCEMTFTIAMTVGSVKGAQTLTSKAFGL